MRRHRGIAIVASAFLVLVLSGSARAQNGVLATLTAESPVSAGDGWVVWSVPAPHGWRLAAYHRGAVRVLDAAPRPQPFDVSVGTDRRGVAVAVFSRCARTPVMQAIGGERQGEGGILLEPDTGRGCRIHAVGLSSGHERSLAIPAPAGTSDTTPSIWRGRIAFARKAPGHGDIWQVLLWNPAHPGTLRVLPHGAVPTKCEHTRVCRGNVNCAHLQICSGDSLAGRVQAIASDGNLVTFLWNVQGPGVFGRGSAWEIRVDDLRTGRAKLVDSGFRGEACTSPPGFIEQVGPEPPTVTASQVTYSTMAAVSCFTGFRTLMHVYRLGVAHASSANLSNAALEVTTDGSALYALLPSHSQPGGDSPVCSAIYPCTLRTLQMPPLSPDTATPVPPFEEFLLP
jgi:hypothetical protein